MTLELSSNPVFAAHQTFHPRFGWLRKAIEGVTLSPVVFSQDDSTLALGVGKNMVEAIRFWALATRIIEIDPENSQSRPSRYRISEFGRRIFDDELGLDPYLENVSTLWILHWSMLTDDNIVPIWWLTFNSYAGIEFSADVLENACFETVQQTSWKNPNPSSIAKDVDALIRMYSTRPVRARQTVDDVLDSPFRELGIVRPSQINPGGHRFVVGPKPGLNPMVIAYTCTSYISSLEGNVSSASIHQLARDPGSPGRLLKLDDRSIADALSEACDAVDFLQIAERAGTLQLGISIDIDTALVTLLERGLA